MVKEIPEQLSLPMLRLKSKEIIVIKKHGHLFEDEDSIKDAIVLGFSTVKTTVHPEAIEKVCDQIEKFSGYHVNCVTYEADRKDNDLRLSDELPDKLMMLKVRSLILLIWSNQMAMMDEQLDESEEEELLDEVEELREVDDDGYTVIDEEGQSMFLTEESEETKTIGRSL